MQLERCTMCCLSLQTLPWAGKYSMRGKRSLGLQVEIPGVYGMNSSSRDKKGSGGLRELVGSRSYGNDQIDLWWQRPVNK